MHRRHLLQALGLSSPLLAPLHTPAQSAKPLRIVVPYAAGGQTDVLARVLGQSMERTLGRTVIVDNKPGAAALIGTKFVQAAAPDGDTVLYHNSGFVGVAMLQKQPPYDPVKDFDPVAMTGQGPNFLMVHESVPARTMPEFLAWARTQTAGIECGNSGINSGGHIAALMLAKLANLNLLHVPYKGSAEVTNAMISGEIKMQVSVTTESLNPYIKMGRIRLLGVATPERSGLAPEVPTIGEFVPGYGIGGWFGLLAPAGTPLARREQIAAAVKVALDEPAVKQRYRDVFQEPVFRGPRELADAVSESVRYYRRVLSDLKLTPQ